MIFAFRMDDFLLDSRFRFCVTNETDENERWFPIQINLCYVKKAEKIGCEPVFSAKDAECSQYNAMEGISP